LQELARCGVLRCFDIMATVSGCGFIGSCLTSLMTIPLQDKKNPNLYWNAKPEFDLDDQFPLSNTKQMHHLRKHGDFLVLRSGLFRREVMRAAGALLSGVLCTFTSYVTGIMLLTALLMYLSSKFANVNMWHYLPSLEVEQLKTMYRFVRIDVLVNFAAFGAIVSVLYDVGFLTITKFIKPDALAGRTGETREDRGERIWISIYVTFALIWLLGYATFVFPTLNPSDRIATSLLASSAFFGGLFIGEIVVYCLLASISLFLGVQWWTRRNRSIWEASMGVGLYGIVISLGIVLFLGCSAIYHQNNPTFYDIGSLISSTALGRLFAGMTRKGKSRDETSSNSGLKKSALKIALSASIFLFVFTSLLLVVDVVAKLDKLPAYSEWLNSESIDPFGFLLAVLILFIVVGYFINYNRVSLHYFYRDRLSDAYLRTEAFKTDDGLSVLRDDYDMRLQDLHKQTASTENNPGEERANPAPYHLIMASLNLAGSRDLARKDRKSDQFVLSREYCGSTTTGYIKTSEYHGGELRLSNAMTISGAAASPNPGENTSLSLAFSSVLFNLRTGQWLDNPRKMWAKNGEVHFPVIRGTEVKPPANELTTQPENVISKFIKNFWPLYLAREVTMNTNAKSTLVNLSDGGHTGDNIGLYPLLQRRCKLIIAGDASCDPEFAFGALASSIQQIFIDENVVVEINLDEIRPTVKNKEPNQPAHTRQHFTVGRITYPPIESSLNVEHLREDSYPQEGWLIFLKSSLMAQTNDNHSEHHGPLPANVQSYAQTNPGFPHETTADQFFEDAQFEAYRLLGQHITETMLSEAGLHVDHPSKARSVDKTVEALIEWCKSQWPDNLPQHSTEIVATENVEPSKPTIDDFVEAVKRTGKKGDAIEELSQQYGLSTSELEQTWKVLGLTVKSIKKRK